jgi:hypothetical protein
MSDRRFIISSVIDGSLNQFGVSNPTLPAELSMATAAARLLRRCLRARAGGFALPSYTITEDTTTPLLARRLDRSGRK